MIHWLALLTSLSLGDSRQDRPVVTTVYENLDAARALKATPVTFSRIGAEGDFTKGMTPLIDGKALPAQVDVLRRAPDGSIRHALVSFVLPNLSAGGKVPIGWLNRKPPAPPPFVAAVKSADLDLNLLLTSAKGAKLTSNLGAILKDGFTSDRIKRLADGPVMKEFEILDVPRDGRGKADPEIEVIWRLRAFTGEKSVRVACIVERTRLAEGGRRPAQYEFSGVKLSLGNRVLFEAGAYDHLWQTRYRIVSWTRGRLENIHRRPDYPYLVKANCFPLYRLQGRKGGNLIQQFSGNPGGRNRQNTKKDGRRQGILDTGIIYRDMPGTGGRWDIGPYPAWSVAYLLEGAPSLYRKILHADGNGSGCFWIHSRQNGMAGWNVFDIDSQKIPLLRNNVIDPWKLPDGSSMSLRPDHAHAPSLGYVAYILTGDRYYAEEMGFWASYQLGEYPHQGLSLDAPARSQAWGFRHIVDAAFLLPDLDPMSAVAMKGALNYVKAFTGRHVASDRKVHFVEESNGFNTSGRLTWVNCRRTSAWMQSWLVWSLQNAALKGIPGAAACRDWAGEYIVGFYASEDTYTAPGGKTYRYDPRDAMSYSVATSLWEVKVVTDKNGRRTTVPVRKIKDLENYGEIWYWTKVNSDNMYSASGERAGLWSTPEAKGLWPLRKDGWGEGMFDWGTGIKGAADHKRWWAWHRYGAWIALVSMVEAGRKDARKAFKTMSALAGDSSYGFEMIPAGR